MCEYMSMFHTTVLASAVDNGRCILIPPCIRCEGRQLISCSVSSLTVGEVTSATEIASSSIYHLFASNRIRKK